MSGAPKGTRGDEQSGKAPRGFIPELDALRAIAVTAVVVHHFVPDGWQSGADYGVKLFFTLSGFLITRLLLRSRHSIDTGRQTFGGGVGRFYARRLLRIFPLYYLVIGVALVINLEPARNVAWWLVTYTLNIHMARQGWFEANFAHFWSLAVEEQFYLVWPWVVLAAPRRWLQAAAVVMLATAPLYKLTYVLSGYENMTPLSAYISTWSCLDSLGAGALLAMAERSFAPAVVTQWLVRRILPLAGAALLYLASPISPMAANLLFFGVAQALVFAAIIWIAAMCLSPTARGVLTWTPLAYVGKISYGIYVYHPFMQEGARALLVPSLPDAASTDWLVSVAAAIATLAVASLSWSLFEAPINSLKRHLSDPS